MFSEVVFAVDLSDVVIRNIRSHNLTRAIVALGGKPRTPSREAFPVLFERLCSKTYPITEPELWATVAQEAGIPNSSLNLRRRFLVEFQFVRGMQSLLQTLRSLRFRTFIWTNMPNEWMDALDRSLGLLELVEGYVNGQNLHWQKPAPGFFQEALDRHGLVYDQIIYVGANEQNLRAAEPFTKEQWLFESAAALRHRIYARLQVHRALKGM